MDNNMNTPPASGSGMGSAGDPREELRVQLELMGKAAGDLLEQLVRVPSTLAQIPMQMLPEDTATHARNAATEGFAAVRTLIESMARGVDDVMRTQRERMAAAGSTQTGVGDPTAPGSSAGDVGGTGTGMESGSTQYLGGQGTGAGPLGNGGSSPSGSNTTRLDDEI